MKTHAVFCAQDRPGNFAGGPNAWLQRLIPDLENDGISVTTLIIGNGPAGECPLVVFLHSRGFPFRFLDTKRIKDLYLKKKIRWLVEQLNELKPDIFIPNLMIPAYYVAGWARLAGIPSIGVIHSDDEFYHQLLDTFVFGDKRRQISAVVAVSKFLESKIAQKKVTGFHLARIPYGVPIPETSTRLASKGLRVVFVGRFRQKQKRILDVTEAFCAAAKVHPAAKFTLLGNGPRIEEMRRIISRNSMDEAVLIHGPLPSSEVIRFLRSQDVIVLLSDYEGLPIALQEAMAVGVVPVCLKEDSGIAELLEHGENGLIVGDRGQGFVSAISELDTDRDLLSRLSDGARNTIESDYASNMQHKEWSQLIQSVANLERKKRVNWPLFYGLPASHPSFNREDWLGPSFWERSKRNLTHWTLNTRLAVRPRSRIREVYRKLKS
ncbi:glycosyltransferase family 4 protein [Pseudomonadota bacterium]